MQTLMEHKHKNRQYANETTETVVIQVNSEVGRWSDYSRCTVEQALAFMERKVRNGAAERWRAVDWITKEEIALQSR
jgi:hypothetical protein